MSDSKCEKAVEKKHNGYNCAQAVACSFCDEAHMDEETLFNLTQGFGAGLGDHGRYLRSHLRCRSCRRSDQPEQNGNFPECPFRYESV